MKHVDKATSDSESLLAPVEESTATRPRAGNRVVDVDVDGFDLFGGAPTFGGRLQCHRRRPTGFCEVEAPSLLLLSQKSARA